MDQQFWTELSEKYNAEVFDVLKNDNRKIILKEIEAVASKSKTVGDVGCAVGKWLPALSPLFKEVDAIDFADSFLEKAADYCKGLKNINYVHRDFSKPFRPTKQFDVILCVNAILMPEENRRKAFYKNLYASLKKGGTMVLVVPAFESALFRESVLHHFKAKKGEIELSHRIKADKKDSDAFKYGILKLDHAPTKHHMKEELAMILSEFNYEIKKIEKVPYSWASEMKRVPKYLDGLWQWDWMVVVKKI